MVLLSYILNNILKNKIFFDVKMYQIIHPFPKYP